MDKGFWLVTIKAEKHVGWISVPKDEARTKKRAERWVEDMLCAAGPDIMQWDTGASVDDLIDACMGWETVCVIDAGRYPETVAVLEIMSEIDRLAA